MFNDEKQLRTLIQGLDIDTEPVPDHKQRLRMVQRWAERQSSHQGFGCLGGGDRDGYFLSNWQGYSGLE